MEEIKEKLKCSLEAAHIRSALALFTFLVISYVTLMTVFWSGITFILILYGLILIPIWAVYGWRYFRIFRRAECCIFRQVVLSQPRASKWSHAFAFAVEFQDESGERITAETTPIFQSHGWLGPIMEDYVNREVTIAYNPETRVLVVLG